MVPEENVFMDVRTYDIITDWKKRVTDLQKANYDLALRYSKLHYSLGVLSVTLAVAVVGFFIFGTDQAWLRNAVFVGGIISVVAFVILVFFNFAKRAEFYRTSISQLVDVRRDIELFENYLPERSTEREERIQKITGQIATIENGFYPGSDRKGGQKGWWILQGFIGAVILFLLALFSTRLFFNQIPFLTTEQSIEFWMREAVQQGVEDWQFDPDDPFLAKRAILINTWINELTTHKTLVSLTYLNGLDDAPIDIYLTATGGFSKDSYAIVNAIQHSDSPVNTIAIGDCFSACSMILMSGTGDRKIVQGSRIAIHTHEYQSSSDPFSYYMVLYDREKEFFEKNSDIPLEWVDGEENYYYLTPEQAVYYRVADAVINTGEEFGGD
jgi:ATP-dependent protease ClpP protease subunit